MLHVLVTAYASKVDHVELSLENCILEIPEGLSLAERLNLTCVELVLRALLLIVILPVGAVVSKIILLEYALDQFPALSLYLT